MRKLLALCSLVFALGVFAPAHAGQFADFSPTDDALVALGNPSTNYGDWTSLWVVSANAQSSYQDERAWVKFNVADRIPAGATITKASLRLYCFDPDTSDDMDAAAVHGVTDDSWSEDTLTWNSQPAYGTQLSQTVLEAGAQNEYKWYEWDVTSFVQAEMAGDQTVSLVVKPTVEGLATWRTFTFNSKEYSKKAYAPRLRIEYTGAHAAGTGFKIFHMNDVHSRLLPHEMDVPEHNDVKEFENVGGAAYFASRMLALKAANPNALILDAGDVSEGSPLGDLRGNGGLVDFYNLLDSKLKALGGRGIDAAVIGNHDVRTNEMLGNLKNLTTYPVISVNICHEGTQNPYFDPWVILNVNGVKVGILGYTSDEYDEIDGATELDETTTLLDVVKCVWEDTDASTINLKDKVQELRDTEGCDVVILLSHVGQSRVVSGDDALLVPDGDVALPEIVISGHWHSWTQTAWQPLQLDGQTIIDEAASYLQYIGELEVNDKGRYIQAQEHPIRNALITPDPDVQNLIESLKAEYAATGPAHDFDEVIGYSAVDLYLDKDKWWTMNEYPWSGDNTAGEWICDGMKWKSEQLGYTCDLAIQTGGGIRRDVPAGWINYGQIYETYPWVDDDMIRVQMTGQEIWNFLEDKYCGASISRDWLISAEDGIISSITYQGSPINLSGTYYVVISDYMHRHESAMSSKTGTSLGYSIREGVVDYTGQFDEQNPMTVPGPRYNLDTELAGGFKAVVTMMADAEQQPYYEAAFVRLIEALPETVARRNGYGLSGLVNADGSINPDHQFAECMLYRSHLGFADGYLKPGDIIELWAEGGFHAGNPQWVEQRGVWGTDTQFGDHGHDDTLARPEFHAFINNFWDEQNENHLVKFYATKTGDSSVRDAEGTEISVYQPGGYYSQSLPGSVGDVLEVTGVNTYRYDHRRFRIRDAAVAAPTAFPAMSSVNAISPAEQVTGPLTLSATAQDIVGAQGSFASTTSTDDAQVVEGYPTSNYGSSTNFYLGSAASGSYKNERLWVKFDTTGQVPAGATITGARLKMYCWRTSLASQDMDASVHGVSTDSWTENSITWNNQPAYGPAEDTVTIDSNTSYVWYTWDVTDFVSGELGGSDPIMSFVVKPVTESTSTSLAYGFDSKEYSGGSLAPVLEIDYETTGGGTSGGIQQVQFQYRYSNDGSSWSGWTPVSADTAEPYEASFSYPDSYGFYEFISVATDVDGNVEDAPVYADAKVRFTSLAPNQPADPSIGDGATGVSTDPTLSVTVSDSDSPLLDVYFYLLNGDGSSTLVGAQTGVSSGSTAGVDLSGLDEGKTYQWYVVTQDDAGETSTSPVMSFTTLAAPVPGLGLAGIMLAMAGMVLVGMRRVRGM